jgi:hypothetical protein
LKINPYGWVLTSVEQKCLRLHTTVSGENLVGVDGKPKDVTEAMLGWVELLPPSKDCLMSRKYPASS